MTKSKIFFILSLSFIGGVATASFLYPKDFSFFYIILFFAAAIISGSIFWEDKRILLASSVAVLFFMGIYLTEARLQKIKNLGLDSRKISQKAVIVKEPELKEKYQKIIVRTEEISDAKILVNVFDKKDYSYGDKVKLDCLLKIPENFSSDFDYRMYLAKDGIFYECEKPEINSLPGELKTNEGNSFYKFILKIKNKFNQKINQGIPSPQSGLLSGLLLGGDSLISKSWQEKFSRTGMTHVVAVSGYNVTIVAEYLMMVGIFLGLWRRQAFYFATLGIIIFVVATGLSASAVRAGVMGILLIWAMKNGRLANAQNAILFSAIVMLFFNPLLLRWDIGFQLSFLATLGVVYLYPVFEGYFIQKEAMGSFLILILETLLLSLAAQIFVLPVMLYNFNQLSLISPLANILILPFLPITMMLGFVAAVCGFVFSSLAPVFSWLAYLPLKYETFVVDYLSGLKYSSVEFHLSFWGVAVWYIILAGMLRYKNGKKEADF
jgi:competence protein ComEC